MTEIQQDPMGLRSGTVGAGQVRKQESLFQNALKEIEILLRQQQVVGKTVFISYAREDESSAGGLAANTALQAWLQRIAEDLSVVGARVYLDLEGVKNRVARGIAESDCIVIVGTPQYKVRASQETNLAVEYRAILEKLTRAGSQCNLLPLLYSGDFEVSFPPEALAYSVQDFRETSAYYRHLLGSEQWAGMVPSMYLNLKKEGEQHAGYVAITECFFRQLRLMEAEAGVLALNRAASLATIPAELPAPAAYFVDRVEAIQRLAEVFATAGTEVVLQAIVGIRGTGKSQLAAEYAHQSKTQVPAYRLIRWLKADSPEAVETAYFTLGDELGLRRQDYADDRAGYRRAIDRQLRRYERILLIYDNVESLAHVEAYLPVGGEESATVHVLLTSRQMLEVAHRVTLAGFDAPTVQLYLTQRLATKVTAAKAQRLGEALGYLPIAVVQAAGYMVQYHKSVTAFIKLLTGRAEKLPGSDPALRLVSTLWSLTVEKLAPNVLEVLEMCAYLDPDGIPVGLVTAGLGETEADEAVYTLRSLSLLLEVGSEAGTGVVRVHRLLQAAIRQRLTPAQGLALVERAVQGLRSCVYQDRYQPEMELRAQWQSRPMLAKQVLRLLAEGQALELPVALLADLAEWAGDYARHLPREYDVALSHYIQCLAWRQAACGAEVAVTGDTWYDLGMVHYVESRYEEALECFTQALEIFEEAYGTQHPAVAASFEEIGMVYYAQGNYADALAQFEESLAIRRVVYGDEHLLVAASLQNVGAVYQVQGEYVRALAQYEQSLAIRRAVYGDRHPLVAKSLQSIGAVYNAQGDYPHALAQHERSLAIRRAVDGDNHPEVARSLHNIGAVYYAQGNYTGALAQYEQSLAIDRAMYGDNHPTVSTGINNIGFVYYAQGNYTEALAQYEQSLAIDRAVYGDNHPAVATSLNNIGSVYQAQEDYTQALAQYERSLAIYREVYGDDHPEVATSFNNIGTVYKAQGRYVDALAQFEQSLVIWRAAYGDNHPKLVTGLNNIGLVYNVQGKYTDALVQYTKSLMILGHAMYSDNHPLVAQTLKNIEMTRREMSNASRPNGRCCCVIA